MKKIKSLPAVFLLLCAVPVAAYAAGKAKGGAMTVENGRKVSFDYTLTVENKVVDSSAEHGPLIYTHGERQIIPGLEKELAGLKSGAEKTVKVAARDAYGEIDPQAEQEIPRSELPQDMEPQVGMVLAMSRPDGQKIPVRIKEVGPETITIDFNHPLAGKELEFSVKIVSVE